MIVDYEFIVEYTLEEIELTGVVWVAIKWVLEGLMARHDCV